MAWFTLNTWLFIISMGVQAAQASRARAAQREAAAAADLAKGFQIVTSGEPAAIPVVYGRAKIGGSRVYHKAVSQYTVPSNINDLVAAAGGKVLTAIAPVVPVNPPAGFVRAYFEGPANLDITPIANSEVGELPIIEVSTVNSENGGNYDFGGAFGTTESNETPGDHNDPFGGSTTPI